MRRSLRPLLCSLLLSVPIGCDATSTNRPPSGDKPAELPAADTDGDGISDAVEGRADAVDTDRDGQPDFEDTDSDNDGLSDKLEGAPFPGEAKPRDSDGDGVPDVRDEDSDNNGLPDEEDGDGDRDGDGTADYADPDDDGDGLLDVVELGSDPLDPVNIDGDRWPDFRDRDSDDDGILDRFEREFDVDGDRIPAFRDLDSDGDCRPDSVERGDGAPEQPPIDSDMDGGGDFLDLDSDNDGLLDELEDVDCDGVLDPGESSTAREDTDDDGVSDLIEQAAGTNPNDDLDNPRANGDFVFIVPYQGDPDPAQDTLDFSTNISQADVVFAMDTTATMGGQINNLKGALQEMINQLAEEIPNIGIGVTQYKDFPINSYGGPNDQPFYLEHRVMSVRTPAGRESVQDAVDDLKAEAGGDIPESGWEALYQIATGAGTNEGGAHVPMFNPLNAPPGMIPAGEAVGTIGGVGFRFGSLPIVVMITDTPSHNGTFVQNNYSTAKVVSPTYSQALRAVTGVGGRVIGMVAASSAQAQADAEADLTAGAVATGSVVPPAAWGPEGVRPPRCAVGQCCIGENGSGVTMENGKCPLVFRVASSGAGLNLAVVQAIKVLTTYVTLDISAAAVADETDAVDAASAFIDKIIANNDAPEPCTAGLRVIDKNVDGVADTYTNVFPGPTVCFDVIPKTNVSVPPTTEPQVFTANIVVTGDGVTTLSTRKVFFLVPPEIPVPPID
ncbi:VWA domain-containing protein [Sorangium atrum]|uniref:VWA domain-containing protein n=1 Tax=Sorangium atrum TaxID=2995308 RepID=A0ABT5C0M7_9BACT|nr:VWA domain-containing protein [Sorangium aterium]MDC0679931.1 VWA domain-containing protein [Sorangium aterium]